MITKVQWFDLYVQAGLQPIAVYSRTKKPVERKWNKNWTVDRWRPFFEKNVSYDMGILLGEIIDVEGDTEEANDLLNRMTNHVPHPRFRSSKSTHHLFLNPDPFLTRKTFNGMEFRAYNHQSIVPPSTHEFGSKYGWLVGSKLSISKMPDELLEYYEFNKSKHKESKHKESKHQKKEFDIDCKEGYTKMQCKTCKKEFFIHEKRLLLEIKAFQEYNLPWMCHGCREFDLRQQCRIIRKFLNCGVYQE